MTRLGLFIKLYFFSWTWFLLLGVVLSNDDINNDDALEGTGKSLKISQACAPHSRSRHTVDVQSVYLSCWEEEDENGNVGNDGNYYPDSFSDLIYICKSGETARLVVDCKFCMLSLQLFSSLPAPSPHFFLFCSLFGWE